MDLPVKIVNTNPKGEVTLIGTFTTRQEAQRTLVQIANGELKVPKDTVSLFIVDSTNPPLYFTVNGMLSMISFYKVYENGAAWATAEVRDQFEMEWHPMSLLPMRIPRTIKRHADKVQITLVSDYPTANQFLRQQGVVGPPTDTFILGEKVYSVHDFLQQERFSNL